MRPFQGERKGVTPSGLRKYGDQPKADCPTGDSHEPDSPTRLAPVPREPVRHVKILAHPVSPEAGVHATIIRLQARSGRTNFIGNAPWTTRFPAGCAARASAGRRFAGGLAQCCSEASPYWSHSARRCCATLQAGARPRCRRQGMQKRILSRRAR